MSSNITRSNVKQIGSIGLDTKQSIPNSSSLAPSETLTVNYEHPVIIDSLEFRNNDHNDVTIRFRFYDKAGNTINFGFLDREEGHTTKYHISIDDIINGIGWQYFEISERNETPVVGIKKEMYFANGVEIEVTNNSDSDVRAGLAVVVREMK